MKLRNVFLIITLLSTAFAAKSTNPVDSLAMRVTEGTSAGRILFHELPSEGPEFFEISADSGHVKIEGNSRVALATGLNWYLKYVAGIHISWNNLTQPLPEPLPLPGETIRKAASVPDRYYLNYCTYSYSMPFWDEDRWMKEIDWMALHGINMPLTMTGIETVWRNMLKKLGYTDEEIGRFISGPAFFAWWQMNNLEGWGGPLPDKWYERQTDLQHKIVARMRSLGIEPVYPGYAGMVPHDIHEKLGFKVTNTGKWCGFVRPAFLSPDTDEFPRLADMYYRELDSLYGKAKYYSMDPFHEGGPAEKVDIPLAGRRLKEAMKRANPESEWVIQSWGGNPRRDMIDTVARGDMKVLDLYSDKDAKWRRPNVYGDHEWIYCMLLNFGGNIGLHGRMDMFVDGFYDAMAADSLHRLTGVGLTPEGIENNPVMYELAMELPWRSERFDTRAWLKDYLSARYGREATPEVIEAWDALRNTVYNAPVDMKGQGTLESLFCARPSWTPRSASTWGSSEMFYSPDSTAKAARLMLKAAPSYGGNANFAFDLADIRRQANADEGNRLIRHMADLKERGLTDSLTAVSERFLNLILMQDSTLSVQPDMCVDTWLDAAGNLADDDTEARKLYRRNAAQLITVWGDSVASNLGGLHDYSHREWSGLLRELYYQRWKAFFDSELRGAPKPDFYLMETEWVGRREND